MKTQFLLRTLQQINKCNAVDEIALAVLMQLLIMISILAMRTSLKFITKALVFVQSSPAILPTFDLSKQQ